MTLHSSGDQIDTVLAHLRAEQPLEDEPVQQALLRHEAGVLEEARGDEAAAMREYLAALDISPDFRESLEALVRIYGSKGAGAVDDVLPKLLETLSDLSMTPADSARALWELAAFRQDLLHDLEGARDCLEQAVDLDPGDAACWLELELLAAKQEDQEARARALDARSELTQDPTWQGLLLLELAGSCAAVGDLERAASLLDSVVALEGKARFLSRLSLEIIGAHAQDPEMSAHALEGQALLITQAIEDAECGDRWGIPSVMRTMAHAADAYLRAGEIRRRHGDHSGALLALTNAAEKLPDSGFLALLKMSAADAAGDQGQAIRIAREQLEQGVEGVIASALWLRMARAAEEDDDRAAALKAYDKAIEQDPRSLVALTRRLDLLAQGEDAEAWASGLQQAAESATSEEAKSRAWLSIAYVWAVRAGSEQQARAALAQAAQHGTSQEQILRLSRALASIIGSASWYEQSTAELLEAVPDAPDRPALCFELGRSKLLRGDEQGALLAFAMLSDEAADEGSPSAWLGRLLATYAVGLPVAGRPVQPDEQRPKRDVGRLADLARSDADRELGQGLMLIAASSAARNGDTQAALELLQAEHEREPADVAAAIFLADLQRRQDDAKAAAHALSTCGEALDDPTLAAALQLEAALLLWRSGDLQAAVPAIEVAMERAPKAAQILLSWALKSAKPNDLDARRRVVELTEEQVPDQPGIVLERLALGLASPDGDSDVWGALEQLEELSLDGELGQAAALARVLWSNGGSDVDALGTALDEVEQLGGAAVLVAAAERYRLARLVERDAHMSLEKARSWALVDRSPAPALEWLAAALGADDRGAEVAARNRLATLLQGEASAALASSAAMVKMLDEPDIPQPFLTSDSDAARLMNLELVLPGGNPTRRAEALRGLGDALDEESQVLAEALAAWSDLVAGDNEGAQAAFLSLVEQSPTDMTLWEGVRAASERLSDHLHIGLANARLGELCKDDARAAELWETAGLVLLEHTDAHDDAEIAFEKSLERDQTRAVAFDKLFRKVRARKDNDKLLELIALRLEVADDQEEITKMYWERARVLRSKGDADGAVKALADVTMLEADHVGALALMGEIHITQGNFKEAAPILARLALLDAAPKQQRLMSGVAAVDLYEKRLKKPEKAVEVLSGLYQSGLSTAAVRERLARTAAKVGKWEEATTILERLMEERDSSQGRSEAARLAMTIYRDKLKAPERAAKAVAKLLEEQPDDAEAVTLILATEALQKLGAKLLPVAQEVLLKKLAKDPFEADRVALVANITKASDEHDLHRAALGCLVALGRDSDAIQQDIAQLDAQTQKVPQIVLDAAAVDAIADKADSGPLRELFGEIGHTISEALGPNQKSLGVGRRQRVGAGDRLRLAVARWMAALGFEDFDLYIGGPDDLGVYGISDDPPAIVLGSKIQAPLDGATRAKVARAAFALRRGTTAVLRCDDNTIASIGIAACNYVGVQIPEPPFTVYREVDKAIRKAMARKVRKAIPPFCERVARSGVEATQWAAAARRSLDRMALIAVGTASTVLDDIVGPPGTPQRATMASNERAQHLLAFALSAEYLELRSKLGMGIA